MDVALKRGLELVGPKMGAMRRLAGLDYSATARIPVRWRMFRVATRHQVAGTMPTAGRLVHCDWLSIVASMFVAQVLLAVPLKAQEATRDLPDSVVSSETFTVSITLTTPGGTGVVGVEDWPPSGWVVSNISDGGVVRRCIHERQVGSFF